MPIHLYVYRHVGLLKIVGDDYQLEKIRLKSVRPFVIADVVLSDIKTLHPRDHKAVQKFLQDKVRSRKKGF